jgi:hypothetical protein
MQHHLFAASPRSKLMLAAAQLLVFSCLAGSLTADGNLSLSGFDLSKGTIPIPKWSNGAVIAIEGQTTLSPVVHVFDAEGNYVRSAPFSLDGANWLLVRGYSYGPDGSIALCGQAKDARGRVGHFLAILPPDPSAPAKVVRTFPYSPASLAIAPDGTIWTMGVEYDPAAGKRLGRAVRPQATVIRHFDRQANQIGGFITEASVAPLDPPRPTLNGGLSNLAASRDRVGWYQGGGKSYFEITSDGTVHTYPSLALGPGEDINGLAITENGAAFISKIDNHKGTEQVYQLDRVHAIWQPVQLASAGPVVGANGNAVAVYNQHQTISFLAAN